MYVNGNGPLNSNNILWKSYIVEDFENVVITKTNSVGEIHTKEEKSLLHIFTKKGYASGSSKKGKEVEKTIVDPLLKVNNTSMTRKSVVRIWSNH